MDEKKIENAFTDNMKYVCIVHYTGVDSEMDVIMGIEKKYNLMVEEDAV